MQGKIIMMYTKWLIFFLSLFVFQKALSASLHGEIIEVDIGGGALVKVKVFGDEYNRYYRGVNDYTLIADYDSNLFYYAMQSKNGNHFTSSGIPYFEGIMEKESILKKRLADIGIYPKLELLNTNYKRRNIINSRLRSKKVSPKPLGAYNYKNINDSNIGKISGYTLLIDFPDQEARVSPKEIFDFMNQKNGYIKNDNNGSIFNYFHDVSGGKLNYTNIVSDHYYRTPMPKSYYDQAEPEVLHAMINDALDYFNKNGEDFSQLTVNSEGHVRALNVLYAGNWPAGSVTGLWPHAWDFGENEQYNANGVVFSRYQISPIYDAPKIGVIVHENGHMLFDWPDLYGPMGLGSYCVMSQQHSTNPQWPNPYLRELAGWEIPQEFETLEEQVTANSNESFAWENSENPNEFYYIDARTRQNSETGRARWENEEGLYIWHVDKQGKVFSEKNSPQEHPIVSLKKVSKKINKYGFSQKTTTDISDITYPNTHWWDRNLSGLTLSDISVNENKSRFSLGEPTYPDKVGLTSQVIFNNQIIPLSIRCDLIKGSGGVAPVGGNFKGKVRAGDKIFINSDGATYAVEVLDMTPWWLYLDWSNPYMGQGSRNGECSIIRESKTWQGGSIEPEGFQWVYSSQDHFIDIYPDSGFFASSIKVNGIEQGHGRNSLSIGPIETETQIEIEFDSVENFPFEVIISGKNGMGDYSGNGFYKKGEMAKVSIEDSYPGYEFSHWIVHKGDFELQDPYAKEQHFLVTQNTVILAVYIVTPIMLNLEFVEPENGQIFISNIDQSPVWTLKAKANAGWLFSQWKIKNGKGNIASPHTANTRVHLYQHTLIEAEFVRDE